MKTVMDAVNEFKGEWPYSDSIVMYYYAGTNGYGFYSRTSKSFRATGFTSECFNDLVSQLSTNFGLVTTGHLRLWQRELKSQEVHDINERFNELEQPVFTQAMADNGELPLVGMEVTIDSQVVQIVGITTKGKPIFELPSGYVDSFSANTNFKPIDTRTDKEKAVDEFIDKVFGTGQLIDRKLISLAYDAFSGDKWVGE